jgi:hypothetical protein
MPMRCVEYSRDTDNDYVSRHLSKPVHSADDRHQRSSAQLHRFYALTTQLKVQLQALDETLPLIRVEIQEVDPPGDIEAIAFLVLMEATTSAQEDPKAIMAEVKAITTPKPSSATRWNNRPKVASICFPPTGDISSDHQGRIMPRCRGDAERPRLNE